jgi:hypothetical protein
MYHYHHAIHDIQPLILTNVPIASIASVTEDGIPLTLGTDFEVENASGLLWRLASGGARCSWNAA